MGASGYAMDQVLGVYHVENLTNRIRVVGTVTYFEPGTGLVLEKDDKSIWIKTDSFSPMRLGDRAEATGFPAVSNGFLMLYGSAIQDDGVAAPVRPERATWQQLATSRHIFDLVSIEGQVQMEPGRRRRTSMFWFPTARCSLRYFRMGMRRTGSHR